MIFIALGANLPGIYGAPEATLYAAISALEEAGLRVVATSSIWVTEPVPVSDQPLYRNAVVEVQTSLSPQELLALLHGIEADFGRVRGERNAARVLDLDLLAYGDVILDGADISLPHPRMHERGFVLVPLCEIADMWIHPVLKQSAQMLRDALPDQDDLSMMSIAA